MHIPAKADYAVRALLELARDTARPLTCESIASSQEIPFRFLKSVVGDLRRAGLVHSQRGCEGGYWLGRAETAWYAGCISEVAGHAGAPRAARLVADGVVSGPS